MIINFSLVRLSIIFLLVILLPLFQKQWLNLYLFNINNFTLYKFLYYLSGLIIPILVILNSLNKFTFYKFKYTKKNNYSLNIQGKLLLFISLCILIFLSFLITSYIFTNFTMFENLLISDNKSLVQLGNNKKLLIVAISCILLIFKKTRILLKKIILINFLMISTIIWYSHINNAPLIDLFPRYLSKLTNINYINIIYIFTIDTMYYFWSYISNGTNLSDWNVPVAIKEVIYPILSIIIFYFLIILYYSMIY